MPLTQLEKYVMNDYQYSGLDVLVSTYFESADAINGNSFALSANKDYLIIDNAGASSATVTIETTTTVGGFDVDDLVISIAAGERKMYGPFNRSIFEQSGTEDGKISLVVSGAGAADISYLVFQVN